jgi:homoserine trans-succinylase
VDEILTGLSIEKIETVFVDWMNRLQRLIDWNGDNVSWNITSEFLNWIKQWQAC